MLQAVSSGGHETTVKLLLSKDTDISTHEGWYDDALQTASYGGYNKIVELLLSKGADINTQGGYHGNALRAASSGGHRATVELLLNKGANVNTQEGQYDPALQIASDKGYDEIVELLLIAGRVDLDSKESDGQTPLSQTALNIHDQDLGHYSEEIMTDAREMSGLLRKELKRCDNNSLMNNRLPICIRRLYQVIPGLISQVCAWLRVAMWPTLPPGHQRISWICVSLL